jgi:hypothetical protein
VLVLMRIARWWFPDHSDASDQTPTTGAAPR